MHGRFATALRARRIVGVRGSDGRVHVPPVEYDPDTAAVLDEFVPVGPHGTVVSWSWLPSPLEGQAAATPVRLGIRASRRADTPLLHAVDVPSPGQIRTGMRVQARWAEERAKGIRDIACFQPESDVATGHDEPGTEPVTMLTTPVHLSYQRSASPEESRSGIADSWTSNAKRRGCPPEKPRRTRGWSTCEGGLSGFAAAKTNSEESVVTDVAVIGFAQAPNVRATHGTTNGVEVLVPIFRADTGLAKDDTGFWCSGSSDYLAGRAFSFIAAVDAIGAFPPINESHVEMDAAWACTRRR
ncbi:putative OB-fold protein [Saccharopolyspora spinosa]|uniref:OB-fold protein n=1 Tax=Saccharopolyspora spinosa TaxID=60894 RepID=A0A2N3XYA4_SACSN|nr:putative OB-fold protein [Saccharopolyspora spinosa]